MFLFSQPDEVAQTLDLLLEFCERAKVFLLKLYNLGVVTIVCDTVQPFRPQRILDVEHRFHHEIAPLVFAILTY